MPKGSPEDIESLRKLTKLIKPIIWLVPIVLIPAGVYIYFTEGQNLMQLLSIIGFAIVLFLLLRWAINATEKRLQ